MQGMRAWLMGGFIFLSCSALAQTEQTSTAASSDGCSSCVSAQAEERTPCEEVSSLLPYTSYGIGFPKGEETLWKCDAIVDEKPFSVRLVRWRKEEKKILLGEYNIEELGNSGFEGMLRDYFELFRLSDKDKKYKGMYQAYLDYTKGVLFGKNNNKIVVYHFRERPPYSEESAAIAFVHKKGSDKYLNINCAACSFDEFMSHIVVPVIQE